MASLQSNYPHLHRMLEIQEKSGEIDAISFFERHRESIEREFEQFGDEAKALYDKLIIPLIEGYVNDVEAFTDLWNELTRREDE